VRADIVEEKVDAIANSADRTLYHNSGLAGAIAHQGGPTIQEQSDHYLNINGPLNVGACTMTQAGRLSSNFIIHCVGPTYN
jgi:O-acetyl-ADP-ribose deacetylase (regulator of RNase III)